eukprot:197112_1
MSNRIAFVALYLSLWIIVQSTNVPFGFNEPTQDARHHPSRLVSAQHPRSRTVSAPPPSEITDAHSAGTEFVYNTTDMSGDVARAMTPKDRVIAAIETSQPGYCVRKDCHNCLKLEAMVGIAGLCKSTCEACTYCCVTKSCSAGWEIGMLSCGVDCGVMTLALASFYVVKAKCPSGYVWLKEHCPNPFYEKKNIGRAHVLTPVTSAYRVC